MPPYEIAPDAEQGIEGNETETNTHEGTDLMTTITHLPYGIVAVLILWGYDTDDASTFAGIPIEHQPSFTLAHKTSVTAMEMLRAGRSRADIEQFILDELEARPSLRRGALQPVGGV